MCLLITQGEVVLGFKELFKQQKSRDNTAENSLFNFRWKNSKLDQLRALAVKRGVTASSIVKNLLLLEFEREENKTQSTGGMTR